MAELRSQLSKEFLARSLSITPGGAQTRSKRAEVFPDPFPVALDMGSGQRVRDNEGRWYTDWICGLGAVSLGYAYPPVEEAVMRQHWKGVSFSLPNRLETEVSELLIDTLRTHGLPHAEQVRWVKTGSESTAGAMMIARRYTKRDLIVSIGYHGWHEAHQESAHLTSIPWNDLDKLERVFTEKNPFASYPPVAAVLLEACRDSKPSPGYLEGIQELCQKHGALLISDECVTGFRWAIGGASEYFGFEPDLAVYGKGLANGYPLACIVGSSRYMSHAIDVSSTYGGEVVSLAAAKVVLNTYRKDPVIKHMWEVGQAWLDSGLAEGYSCHPRLKGNKGEVLAKVGTLALRGHLVHPAGFNVGYSHTIEDAKEAISALVRS